MGKIEPILLLLVIIGGLPLVMVLIKRSRQRAFVKKAIATTAEVTHCEKRIGFRGGVYYILSLEYNTLDGSRILGGRVGSKKKEKGDRIPLMYLPEEPAKFRIDFGRKISCAIILCGLFFGLVVWLCYWINNLDYRSQ